MMDEISLYRLRVFVTVVERGGVLNAARALHVSQPAVSEHLRQLENKVGAPLLVRRRGARPELTEAGQALWTTARAILAEMDAFAAQLAQCGQGLRGRLQLAANYAVGDYLLPPLLAEFKRRVPEAMVQLTVERRETVADDVLQGHQRLGIVVSAPGVGGLVVERLGAMEVTLVCAPSHPLARRSRIERADWPHLPLISGLRQSLSHQRLVALLESHHLYPGTFVLECGDEASQREACLAGAGACLLFRAAVHRELAAGQLCELNAEGLPLSMPVYLLTAPHFAPTPLEARFLAFLRRHWPSSEPASLAVPSPARRHPQSAPTPGDATMNSNGRQSGQTR